VADVAAVSPEDSSTAQAIANGRNWSTSVVGESPDYLKSRWKLTTGSMFTTATCAARPSRRDRFKNGE